MYPEALETTARLCPLNSFLSFKRSLIGLDLLPPFYSGDCYNLVDCLYSVYTPGNIFNEQNQLADVINEALKDETYADSVLAEAQAFESSRRVSHPFTLHTYGFIYN